MSCSICNGLPNCPCCAEPDNSQTVELEVCDNCGEESEELSECEGWQMCNTCIEAHEEQLNRIFSTEEVM